MQQIARNVTMEDGMAPTQKSLSFSPIWNFEQAQVERRALSRGSVLDFRLVRLGVRWRGNRLARANSQKPLGSYAGRPLGQTAGVLRFHSSLEGLTDIRLLCSEILVSNFIQTRIGHRI
jgi:hypothetical protein